MLNGRPARFPTETFVIWERLRRDGWSYERIARAFGCHHTTVMYHLDARFRERKERRRKERAA